MLNFLSNPILPDPQVQSTRYQFLLILTAFHAWFDSPILSPGSKPYPLAYPDITSDSNPTELAISLKRLAYPEHTESLDFNTFSGCTISKSIVFLK